MKRWSIKLLSVLMVTMFVVSMSSTPVFAEISPQGNTFFEEWSESVSESDVVSELAGEPLDQQASFEAAVEIIEAIEAERMENAYIAEGPSLESILENDNYEVLTPEQLWDTFLQEKATSSQLASASLEARYEFRTFTNEAFAGEERFAIYDNSTSRVVTGWEEDSNNPGKWWYYTEDGSNGNTDLIEDAADYYNNNTDGLVVINTGSQFTTETAAVVVEYGYLGESTTAARTYLQNEDGAWLNGVSYDFDMQKEFNPAEGSFSVGETIKGIIVFNYYYIESHNVTPEQIVRILRHEMGHVIGLRHTYDTDYGETDPGISALMYPKYNSSYASSTFTTYDLNELGQVYPY